MGRTHTLFDELPLPLRMTAGDHIGYKIGHELALTLGY